MAYSEVIKDFSISVFNFLHIKFYRTIKTIRNYVKVVVRKTYEIGTTIKFNIMIMR